MADNQEEACFLPGLYNVQDAVKNRRIMGIARVNFEKKSVDFYALGPANPVSFSLAPGRQMAYGLHQEIGKYQFWSFDLANHKLDRKAEFPGRPRMSLKTSSNGKVLYIYHAGNTIDLYGASTSAVQLLQDAFHAFLGPHAVWLMLQRHPQPTR